MDKRFEKIKDAVERELSCSAHDMDHVMRVYHLALHIAKGEDVDLEVIKAGALLHDIARVIEDEDKTGTINHADLSAEMAVPILKELDFSDEKIRHIQDCIRSHRYKTENLPKTKEAQIIFDSDKLDTLGAIGIARAFVWVGRNNANIYRDPKEIDKYIKDNLGGKKNGIIKDNSKHSPQLEFETKIKFLKDKIHTEKGKEIFKERYKFYREFMVKLEKEVKGQS